MDCNAFFEVLEVGHDFEVLFELAVDLGEEVDFYRVKAFAEFIHLIGDAVLSRVLPRFKFSIEKLEIREVKDIGLIEVDAVYFFIAAHQFWFNVDRLKDEICPFIGPDLLESAQIFADRG